MTRPCRRRLATTASDSEGCIKKIGWVSDPGPSRALRDDEAGARLSPSGAPHSFDVSLLSRDSLQPVAWLSVPRSPSAVSRPGVFPAAASHRATARKGATHEVGPPLKCLTSCSPPAPRHGNGSPGISFLTTHTSEKGPVVPGDSILRHLPSSGFWSPSRRLTPFHASRRPVSHRSVHRIPPSGPRSSRPAVPLLAASPLLSFLRPGQARTAATPEVDSGPGRGPTTSPNQKTNQRLPNLALLGFRPPRLSPPSPWSRLPGSAPHTLSAESAPYVSTSGRGSRDLACDESGLPLSRLPTFMSFCTADSLCASSS